MKTVLITGTTNGIGRVTALKLAEKGHRIVMANRNREKAEQLAEEIRQKTGNSQIALLDLNLASLQSVRDCAAEFLDQYETLDILLNNAGIMAHEQEISPDGLEMQFAVNNLSQWLYTRELLPALEAGNSAHVIFVTSMMHKYGKLEFDSFKGTTKYSGSKAYNQSKLALMLNARELAARLEGKNIAVNTLHPGAVSTGILDGYPPLIQPLIRLFFTTPEKGARTSLFLANMSQADRPTGRYFNNSKEAKANPLVEDAALREKLWIACSELAGVSAAL